MPVSQDEGRHTRAAAAPSLLRTGRELAGMSQEALAEYLTVDVRTVKRYEAGDLPTPDRVMLDVAELAEQPALLYKHFKQKYGISDEILPPIEVVPLAVAVINLLRELRKLETAQVASKLLDMADDGTIDPDEEADFAFVMDKLDGVRRAVELLRYSRKEG